LTNSIRGCEDGRRLQVTLEPRRFTDQPRQEADEAN
jgi:hypothetical protein